MSVIDTDVIDMWGIPKLDGHEIILAISDHLEWGDGRQQGEHLLLLQEKINTYIAFIESGEIYTEIPNAIGKYPIIQILAKHELPAQGETFIERASDILKEAGIGLEHIHSDS